MWGIARITELGLAEGRLEGVGANVGEARGPNQDGILYAAEFTFYWGS